MPHVDIGDIAMYYEIFGSGPPLLLLHGAGQTSRSWDTYIETFSNGFQVIVPDLRGHGRTKNPSRRLSVDLVAVDIAEFIEKMKIDNVLAWGFSFGAHVLFELAIRWPHRLKAMVAESFAAIADKSLVKSLKGLRPELLERKLEPWELKALEEEHIDWRGLYELVSTKLAEQYSIQDTDLEQIDIPCLLVCGDRDAFFPLENILRTYRHLVNARLLVIPNTGHGVRAKYEGLVVKVVLDFLKQNCRDASSNG